MSIGFREATARGSFHCPGKGSTASSEPSRQCRVAAGHLHSCSFFTAVPHRAKGCGVQVGSLTALSRSNSVSAQSGVLQVSPVPTAVDPFSRSVTPLSIASHHSEGCNPSRSGLALDLRFRSTRSSRSHIPVGAHGRNMSSNLSNTQPSLVNPSGGRPNPSLQRTRFARR